MVQINGVQQDAAGRTLADYLREAGYDPRVIAVEYNEAILPKDRYAAVILQDGDVVEIVQFMGGG
ncbi:MAG: sulfur carrier protein ThiS [Eubacterium sp.]|jgi:sulfur carrier protein